MTSSGMRRVLVGQLAVALPREEAFALFTPRGEQAWADGWDPSFPERVGDDAAPGTVFITRADAHEATWIVAERVPDRRMRYARVLAGLDAGTVAVDLEDGADRTTVATVRYDLTALSDVGRDRLAAFAAGYDAELASWSASIERSIRRQPGRWRG